jgi:hypothetical protein
VARAIAKGSGRSITGLDLISYGDLGFPLIPYDGGRIPLEDASHDTVTALLALHHATDLEFSLAECARVARHRPADAWRRLFTNLGLEMWARRAGGRCPSFRRAASCSRP